MQIVMIRPVFKCASDQAIFIGRLKELPGYQHAICQGQQLSLYFSGDVEQSTLALLEDICALWHTHLV